MIKSVIYNTVLSLDFNKIEIVSDINGSEEGIFGSIRSVPVKGEREGKTVKKEPQDPERF